MPKKRLKKDNEEVQEMKGKEVNSEEQLSGQKEVDELSSQDELEQEVA